MFARATGADLVLEVVPVLGAQLLDGRRVSVATIGAILRDALDVRVAEELEQVDDDERLGRARLIWSSTGKPHSRQATGEPVVGVLGQLGELADDVLPDPDKVVPPQSAKGAGADGLQLSLQVRLKGGPMEKRRRFLPRALGTPARGEVVVTGTVDVGGFSGRVAVLGMVALIGMSCSCSLTSGGGMCRTPCWSTNMASRR